ncbi:MAG: hypothetical protein GC164_01820 [Phycisphaera sp.]|nr:hypothetical protein [Phycisphaera sp.]
MNPINFLPRSYIQQQARRMRVYRQLALIAVVALVMLGYLASTLASYRQLRDYTLGVEAEARSVRQQVGEMQKLQAQRKSLIHQVNIQRELAQPLAATQVIATLGQLLPSQITVTRIETRTDRPKPMTREQKLAIESAAKSAAGGKSAKAQARSNNPAQDRDVIHIELTGLAPNDVDVANLVGAIAGHPLFINVKMHHSRPTQVEGHNAREFSIELEAPLDRDYKFDPTHRAQASAGSVSRAD